MSFSTRMRVSVYQQRAHEGMRQTGNILSYGPSTGPTNPKRCVVAPDYSCGFCKSSPWQVSAAEGYSAASTQWQLDNTCVE